MTSAQMTSVGSVGQPPSCQDSNGSQSPMNRFQFFKGLTDHKTTRDGQPQKRRGPKPDSKPAMTRRQELNRQAQRTHRQRKEMYVKALEQEVFRLKEVYIQIVRERDTFAEENRVLKELLAAHGIVFNVASPGSALSGPPNMGFDENSTGSFNSSYGGVATESTHITTPPIGQKNANVCMPPPTSQPAIVDTSGMQSVLMTEYDQIGVDFVLTLERPCMEHIQFLMVRSQESEGEYSGHALLASCPPNAHSNDQLVPNQEHPGVKMPDLLKLLDLSSRLQLEGEITPIMAWSMLLRHEKAPMLIATDFEVIKESLAPKTRCYGFGAVLEEFEVNDAIDLALSRRGLAAPPTSALLFDAQISVSA